jgi:hypothetical protein
MNGRGNRKLIVFMTGMVASLGTVLTALVVGITFTGDNIIALVALFTANGGIFTAGNWGEHRAKALSASSSKEPVAS